MGPHRNGVVTQGGMRSGVNRNDFHLNFKAEWFHFAKTEGNDTGLHRVTESPYPMQKAIRCVMNPVSCNWGLIHSSPLGAVLPGVPKKSIRISYTLAIRI